MTKAAVRKNGKPGALMRRTSLIVAIAVAATMVTAMVAPAAPVGTGVVRWTSDGVMVAGDTNSGTGSDVSDWRAWPYARVAPDGDGGALIVWQEPASKSGGLNWAIYAQRVGKNGSPMWGPNGENVCANTGFVPGDTAVPFRAPLPQIVSDGAGGAIATWMDRRSGTDRDIYAQRIGSGGNMMWQADGKAVCTDPFDQYSPQIVADGASGAIIAWSEKQASDVAIKAQKINSGGANQWTTSKPVLDDGGTPTLGFPWTYHQIISAGAGGAIVTWQDYRNTGAEPDIYAQKLNSSGDRQLGTNGVAVCNASNEQVFPQITTDGAGGAILSWDDHRNSPDWDVYAQRLDSAGSPQWTTDGKKVNSSDTQVNRLDFSGYGQVYPRHLIESDGANGAIVTWEQVGTTDQDIYGQRLGPNGAPLWATGGVAICSASNVQGEQQVTSDGVGGVLVTWQDRRHGTNVPMIYAQRIDRNGARKWRLDGVKACASNRYQIIPQVVKDSAGSAVVAWQETAKYDDSPPVWNIYAQRISSDPPIIIYIDPNAHDNTGPVSIIDLFGANFLPGAIVKLKKAGQDDINGTNVVVVSENKITCMFDLTGVELGLWDVYVENEDGQSVTLRRGFTVYKPLVPPVPLRTQYPRWYLAEGSTAWGFDEYITIINPNPERVTARVIYMTSDGQVPKADIYLPASSQTTINPRGDIGDQDFSTMVECLDGKTIAVDRTMTWTGPGAASPEAHNSIGVTSPNDVWYLPEGSSAWGFESWLLIQNPNNKEATCMVTYMIEGEGPQTFTKKVPPNSRRTYFMADDIGSKDASIKVETDSDTPVIPERAMYRNNRREGHDSIGTITPAVDYYLAEGTTAWGFTTYVLIQNPNDDPANVTLTYMTPDGPVTHPVNPIVMPPGTRKTVRVNDFVNPTDLSTHVHADVPIIAERAMYWHGGSDRAEACHDSIGMDAPHSNFYLPDGQTSSKHETWTLVQNPNSDPVNVEISYLTPNGKNNVTFQETILANSRRTFNMADKGINGRAAVMVVCKTEGRKIMVERAMYWNNRGAGTDTIGGYEDL